MRDWAVIDDAIEGGKFTATVRDVKLADNECVTVIIGDFLVDLYGDGQILVTNGRRGNTRLHQVDDLSRLPLR